MVKNTAQKGIEDVLYAKKLITSDQLSAIKFEHVQSGKSTELIVKERGYVGSDDYVKAFGEVYGIEYINLAETPKDPKLVDIIPNAVAKKYRIVPFALKEDLLSVAMVDPLDLQTIEFIERKTGY